MSGGDTAEQPWHEDAALLAALSDHAKPDNRLAQKVSSWLLSGDNLDSADHTLGDTASRDRADEWAEFIRRKADRQTFLFFAYSPREVLTGLAPQIPEMRRWSTLVDLYEAWSRIAAEGQFGIVEGRGWNVAGAYFTRTRWLLLSLPFRAGWEQRIGRHDRGRVDDDSGRILTLARQARDDWLTVLDQIDEFPRLKQDIDIEAEAETVARLELTRRRLGDTDAELSGGPDSAGHEARRFAVSRMLLPRFALGRVWRVVLGRTGWPARVAMALAATAFAAAVAFLLAGLHDPATGWITISSFAALAGYGLLVAATAVDPAAAGPWLMRQPASAAVGLLTLAALPPDWWRQGGRPVHIAAWAAGLLSAIGVAYLYLEVASHDVRGIRRSWRPLTVGALGYLHAVMVSVIGLRLLLPAFAQRPSPPPNLSCWWHAAGCGPVALSPWMLVLVAASWSFTVGVFLQILWDDQPVTAPLAHVSWRRGS